MLKSRPSLTSSASLRRRTSSGSSLADKPSPSAAAFASGAAPAASATGAAPLACVAARPRDGSKGISANNAAAMDLTSAVLLPPRNSRTQMSAISLDLATERNLPPTVTTCLPSTLMPQMPLFAYRYGFETFRRGTAAGPSASPSGGFGGSSSSPRAAGRRKAEGRFMTTGSSDSSGSSSSAGSQVAAASDSAADAAAAGRFIAAFDLALAFDPALDLGEERAFVFGRDGVLGAGVLFAFAFGRDASGSPRRLTDEEPGASSSEPLKRSTLVITGMV
mmetsp:Transcript_13173/g.29003  ORF Transcript_13173/g.29003 Transcript_13173/m.29003 type:complete len:277 (-) Transcript_13173:85-915(-)